MKKPIFIFCITLFYSTSWGQTIEENYIKSTIYKSETQTGNVPAGEKIETVAYYDGLGRPMQTVGYKAGGSSQDIITPIVYDELGRQVREYLPYADPQQSGNSMSYRDNETVVLPALEGYYLNKHLNELDPNEPNPYSEKVIEASPLNRVLEQGAPGESWRADPLSDSDHTIKFEYLSNNTAEVRRFTVSHPGGDTERTKLEHEGYYLADQLYKVVTKDENWQPGQQYGKDHTTEEFTDKLGRVVLKRTYDKNKGHDTYYVYDDYGNLTYVIPPLASDQIIKGGGVIGIATFNYPWTRLAHVDAGFAEEYGHLLEDYENEAILNLDLENEYGGQGGFSVSTTEGGEGLSLSIVFSANEPLALRQGELVSLEGFGEFGDTELGVLSGPGYEYYFRIDNNAIVVEGEGEVSAINATFGSTTLSYSENYPWTAYTEVNPDFAEDYEGQLDEYPNGQWLTTHIPNQYNGHGGLNISIDEQDKVTVNFTHTTGTPFSLKQGLAIPLEAERRIGDGKLGSFSGPGYEYFFSIRENHLLIEGEGELTSLNGVLTMGPVITPHVSVPVVEGLCYIYHYDHRNRVVEKKIPGKDWQYIVYNRLDRPVLTQDGNLRVLNDWLFTKYDAFGRVAYTGRYQPADTIASGIQGRLELQGIADGFVNNWEERGAKNIHGTPVYYTNQSFPNVEYDFFQHTQMDVYTVHYYDSYAPDITAGASAPSGDIYGETPTTQTKGLPTGNKVWVSGNYWIFSTTYYDEKGRAIYTASHNQYLDTEDVVEIDLDFTGKVLKTKSTHTYGSKTPIEVLDKYTYDHMGRLLTQVQTINNGTRELIVSNTYDELGQLESKKVGGVAASSPSNSTGLQTIDYDYNIRGWLKNINDTGTLGNDLFAFDIGYDRPTIPNTTPLFNGNISETQWISQNDNHRRGYAYGYDALNRIKKADFSFTGQTLPGPGLIENHDLGNVSYDKNGNITVLKRYGLHFDPAGNPFTFDIVDNLSYFYAPQSNTLMKVGDTAHDEGFKNGINSGDDYDYDLNGNLTMDKNKGIAEIRYNHLNLPISVRHNEMCKGQLSFLYSVAGEKLIKRFSIDCTPFVDVETQYAGNFIYEKAYDPATQTYTPARLKLFFHPEGYVEPVDPDDYSQGFEYVYQYTDHLGNVRLSYKKDEQNSVFHEDDFENSTEGWSLPPSPSSVGTFGGALIVNLSSNGDNTHKNFSITPNKPIHIEFKLNAGIIDHISGNAKVYFSEYVNGAWETYTNSDSFALHPGVFEETLTFSSNQIKVSFVRTTTSTESVNFLMPYFVLEQNALQILDEKNYYPFGLEHKGYNGSLIGTENNYKTFQGQEFTKELELNVHEWKYRISDPAIGRFWQIDPLAENFPYNGVYNFAENRVIDGFELEGLEWVDTDDGWQYEGYDYGPQPAPAGTIGVAPAGSSPVAAWVSDAPIPFTGEALNVGGPDGTVQQYHANEDGMVELPHSGTEQTGAGSSGTFEMDGYTVYGYYNRNDVSGAVEDQFGTTEDVASMINAVVEFNQSSLVENPIQIGDMRSPTNGRTNINSTATHHGNNGAFDIRLLGANGGLPGGTTVNSQNYSTQNTQLLINALGNNGFTRFLIGPNAVNSLNNSGTIQVRNGGAVHNNHYHVDMD